MVPGPDERGEVIPAHDGPGYGLAALAGLGDYAGGLIAALAESGVRVGQFHPGCAPGQLEISLPPAGPVDAADLNVFAQQVIRAHSLRHGWRASFSPAVLRGQAGNGGHLPVSIWRGGRNLLADGKGPHGMTADGESFVAGVLAELPALTAVGAPSAASYLRLHLRTGPARTPAGGVRTARPRCSSSPAWPAASRTRRTSRSNASTRRPTPTWRSARSSPPGWPGWNADLEGVHFHDLRHTGNHLTASAGANPRELMARMGHDSERAALIYLHSTAERQRALADAVGEAARAELARSKTRKAAEPSGTRMARNRRPAQETCK